jgi:hypothetical protein
VDGYFKRSQDGVAGEAAVRGSYERSGEFRQLQLQVRISFRTRTAAVPKE